MIAAPVPVDEAERLQALRELLILDTPPEERFDRITRFAAGEFDMPMVALSFVDRDRQWRKSACGLPLCDSPRATSFCGHAIVMPEPLVVPDALKDTRFRDNPWVLGDPWLRFYAGAALRLKQGGSALGTLCVMDSRPRSFDRVSLAILTSLRDLVVEELMQRELVS